MYSNASKVFKEKLENKTIEEDHLPVYQNIPNSQKFQIVNYIENQKTAAQAWEEICMMEFMKNIGERIYKKTVEKGAWDLFSEKYDTFKDINKDKLNKLFIEKMGDDYDRLRIWCSFGSYPTKKAAEKAADEIVKERGKLYGNFVIIENGYYVPFNPTPEMCSDQVSTNKIMNDYMKGQVENRIIKNALFHKRNQTLIEKNIRDAEERGEKVNPRNKYTLDKDYNYEAEFSKYDLADNIDLTIKGDNPTRLEARRQMDLELKIGQWEIISLEGLKHLGYPEETIEMVRKEQEKIKEKKALEKLEEEKKKYEEVDTITND